MRYFATGKPAPNRLREELAKENVKELSSKQKAKKQAQALDRVSKSIEFCNPIN